MSRVIEVDWLGPVAIRVDGKPPPPDVLWRKHLALAVVLWNERPHWVSRQRLMALFWPDRPEAAARHSLNEALRVLRRAFGDEALASNADGVAWMGQLTLDTETFSARAENDPIAAAGLVRGNWCDGLTVAGSSDFEDWLAAERDHWRGQLVATLVHAANILADRGDAQSIRHAEHALKLHPWSDQAASAVMQARWLSGDRAGAVAAGRDHERRLASELGAVPGPSTAALLARLRRGASAPGPVAVPAGREVPPLLFREQLLSVVKTMLQAYQRDMTGGIIACLGAPGSGRSRVLQDLISWLHTTGATTATLIALPGDGRDASDGLHALADAIVRTVPGLGGGDPAAIVSLAARRPAWAERFPGSVGEPTMALTDALVTVLRAASEEGPVVVVVDDLDRFHPDAIASLMAMGRELCACPVTFLVTAAADTDNTGVDALARVLGAQVPGVVAQIPPFCAAHADALIAWGLPTWEAEARARLGRRLVHEAGGSVFIAVEVLDAIRSGLTLPDATAEWPAAGETLDATLPSGTPHALTLALRYAFRQLPQDAQKLLQYLALRSEPSVERDLCGAVQDPTTLAAILDRLEAGGWLVSDHRGYHFAARAVRRFVTQDTMTPGQRRRYREDAPLGGPPDE